MVMPRVLLGLTLVLAGCAAAGNLDTLEWPAPWGVLGAFALCLPGMALIEPPLERKVSRWLGRSR